MGNTLGPNNEFIARVRRTELPDGSEDIVLELIPDTRTVELHEGDEFVTGTLAIDPFDTNRND